MRLLGKVLCALGIQVVLLALAAPAPAQIVDCARGQQAMAENELIFGRNTGRRLAVTEARWARFVAAELAPRFPAGFTVLDGKGQYRPAGSPGLVREPIKIVVIVAPNNGPTRDHVSAIAAAYKRRFSQESVVVISRKVCASF